MRWFHWQTAPNPILLNSALQQVVSHCRWTFSAAILLNFCSLTYRKKSWQNETSLVSLKLWTRLKTVVWQSTGTSFIFLEISWERETDALIPLNFLPPRLAFWLVICFPAFDKDKVQKISPFPLLFTYYPCKWNESENSGQQQQYSSARAGSHWGMERAVTKESTYGSPKGGGSAQLPLVVTMIQWKPSVANFLIFKEKQKFLLLCDFPQFLNVGKYKIHIQI